MKSELIARYSSVQSFYGKARIEEKNGIITLTSYTTEVAYIKADGTPVVKGKYSQTTTRHIKEFLTQYSDYNVMQWSINKILKEFGEE